MGTISPVADTTSQFYVVFKDSMGNLRLGDEANDISALVVRFTPSVPGSATIIFSIVPYSNKAKAAVSFECKVTGVYTMSVTVSGIEKLSQTITF